MAVNVTLHLAPQMAEPVGLRAYVGQVLEPGVYHLFSTSGSEGVPKWVVLSQEAVEVSAAAVNEHLEAGKSDRWLMALPQYHVGGWSIQQRATLSGAAVAVMQGRWSAGAFGEQCGELGITLSSLVPTQVFDLVQARLQAPPGLRAIVVGGGGMSHELGLRAHELGWPVLQSYGMTEAASQVATEPLDHLYAGFDPDALEVLPVWQVSVDAGERLVLEGPALAAGYVLQSSAERGGWCWQPLGRAFTTRDRVALWQHGVRRFLRFLGREADVLKLMGELASLSALQARLQAVSAEAVLVPVPDERRDTVLILAHRLPAAEAARVRQSYDAGVPGFQRIHAAVRVEEIPRSALGKIQMAELRSKVLALLAQPATQADA